MLYKYTNNDNTDSDSGLYTIIRSEKLALPMTSRKVFIHNSSSQRSSAKEARYLENAFRAVWRHPERAATGQERGRTRLERRADKSLFLCHSGVNFKL